LKVATEHVDNRLGAACHASELGRMPSPLCGEGFSDTGQLGAHRWGTTSVDLRERETWWTVVEKPSSLGPPPSTTSIYIGAVLDRQDKDNVLFFVDSVDDPEIAS